MNDNETMKFLKRKITLFSKTIGIGKIGFTNADVLSQSEKYLISRETKDYRFKTNFGDLEKKINPLYHLPEAKSIIVIAVPYGRDSVAFNQEGPRGIFSKSSWGTDYHVVVKELLKELADFINQEEPQAKTVTMVDTGHLLEKSLAEKAGLGWIGKNSLLITPEFGSYVFLGLILTTLPLPEDAPIENKCGACKRCEEHCPGQALGEKGNLNLDRCLANLTLYSGEIDEDLKEKFNRSIYGCDICQEVCPHNVNKTTKSHWKFRPEEEDVMPLLEEIMIMSNKEFKKRFGHMAGSWRGKRPILRNALLVAGNKKEKSLVSILKDLLKHPHSDIRTNAAWALKKIEQED